jgi:hypothetical protein
MSAHNKSGSEKSLRNRHCYLSLRGQGVEVLGIPEFVACSPALVGDLFLFSPTSRSFEEFAMIEVQISNSFRGTR